MATKTKRRRFDEDADQTDLVQACCDALPDADEDVLRKVAVLLGVMGGDDADDMDEATDTYTQGTPGAGARPKSESFAERRSRLAEQSKVRTHFQRFSEDFAAVGTTEAEFLRAFRHARRANPTVTAADFLRAGRHGS